MPTMHTIEEHEAQQVKPYIDASIQNLSTVISKNGAKNLCPKFPPSGNVEGVTYTTDDDGKVKALGTATGQAAFYSVFKKPPLNYLPAGNYIASAGDDASPSLRFVITINDANNTPRYIECTSSAGTPFVVNADDLTFSIYIRTAGGSINGTLEPMIRRASDTDPTYEPYAMTNQQLTQDKVGMDLLSEVGAVNHLNNTAVTAVENGITWTVYDDKSMNANGTQNALGNSIFELGYQSLKKGTYRLTGCPEDGGYNTSIQLYLPNDQYAIDYGDGAVFTLNEDASCRCNIWVKHNASFSNKVFKPMIAPVSYTGPYVPYAKSNRELTENVADIPYVALIDNGSSEYTLAEGAMWQTKGVTFLYVAVQCNTVSPSSGGNHIKISEIPSKFKKPPLILYPAIAPYRDATTGAGTQLQIATNGQIAIRGGEVGGIYSGLFSY